MSLDGPALLFAFLAGIVSILAPCTLPVIPVVLGGAAGPGRRRVLGIFVGFGLTFVVITVLVASTLAALGLTTSLARILAALVIGAVGLVLVVPGLEHRLARLAPGFGTSIGPGADADGFRRGLVLGGAIGLIWAPCVGPLMAAVIATAAVEGPSIGGLAIAAAYVVGVSVPLAAIAVLGRRATRRVDVRSAALLRRAFGVAMVVVSIAVLTRVDVALQAQLTAGLPDLSAPVADAAAQPRLTEGTDVVTASLEDLGPAPELTGITAWLNSEPTTLAALRGNVVLVHFWTFGCINCIHVQPYVKAWYDRYADEGFTVIGVHTPELSFERDLDNVRSAVADAGVRFPVAFDPDFATWRAFGNHYWPAFYFVDRRGHIRFARAGEGEYERSEQVIRDLLAEQGG